MNSSQDGLTSQEAARRLSEYGPNKLPEKKPDGMFIIFLRQFASPLIYILLAATVVLLLLGEREDAVMIFAVVLINSVIGAIQEGKAQDTLLALKKFTQTKAVVIRDGKEVVVNDENLVPGDVVIFQEGEKVPADARIIISNTLLINEAAMTGESISVHKSADAVGQASLSYMGTFIVSGNGLALVTATGIETFIGNIATEIASIDTEMPLKVTIRNLSHLVIILISILGVTLFILGLAQGKSLKEMFFMAVILSISAIPEGLTIVMTMILAVGVWRMSKNNVLVKKLMAVEAFGQAKIIAVDKTGTLTKNEMMVERVIINGKDYTVSGSGYDAEGSVTLNGAVIEALNHTELVMAGRISAYTAGAKVISSKDEQVRWQVSGDPTEAAMLVFARKIGFDKEALETESPKISEIPFDYKLKFHALVNKTAEGNLLSVVGAPENILARCGKIWLDGKSVELSENHKKDLDDIFLKLSADGLRVIALAEQQNVQPDLKIEGVTGLTFVGFLGIRDSLRPEANQAVQRAESAGIKVVMITGDHRVTAEAIARDAGIFHTGDLIIEGDDVERLSKEELAGRLDRVSVFARVTPDHKLKIIQAYQSKGVITAMTGDGVNDAPSLVAADLGVAMGRIGTEVAKEASDIVLLDDNFGSIIPAIEEGRNIYRNLQKVILFLFSTNLGEVMIVFGAVLLNYPLPLLPVQIIWMNLVTDGFLDKGLAMEPKEHDLLDKDYVAPKRYLFDSLMVKRLFLMMSVMTIGSVIIFAKSLQSGEGYYMTMTLTAMTTFQLFNAWNCRSKDRSIFQMNPFSNKYLVGASIIVVSLQLLAVYTPILQKFLHTMPLSFGDWVLIICVSFSIIVVEETRKFFSRRTAK